MRNAARRGWRGGRRAWCVLQAPVVLALMACASSADERSDPPASTECVAEVGALAADATLDSSAGAYRLTLAATATDGALRTVTGVLQLVPNEPRLRRLTRADAAASAPLYGWAEIDLAEVGALEMGDVGSRDPLRPGVLVVEQRPGAAAPASITLRLGSLANRRDGQPASDGGYTALHVLRLDDSGSFAGRWVSGVRSKRVEGHFCATAVAGSAAPSVE